MKTALINLRSGLLAIALAASGFSQTNPPTGPFVLRAPERCEWTITLERNPEAALGRILTPDKASATASSADESSDERLGFVAERIVVSKDGSLYREVTHWANGKKTEKWITDGLQIYQAPTSNRIFRIDLTSYPADFSDYTRSDFELAEWIASANYVASPTVGDQTLLRFSVSPEQKRRTPRDIAEQTTAAEDGLETENDAPRALIALLDAETRLPIYVGDGKIARTYEYNFNPPALTLPPEFRKELTRWSQELAEKNRPPSPP